MTRPRLPRPAARNSFPRRPCSGRWKSASRRREAIPSRGGASARDRGTPDIGKQRTRPRATRRGAEPACSSRRTMRGSRGERPGGRFRACMGCSCSCSTRRWSPSRCPRSSASWRVQTRPAVDAPRVPARRDGARRHLGRFGDIFGRKRCPDGPGGVHRRVRTRGEAGDPVVLILRARDPGAGGAAAARLSLADRQRRLRDDERPGPWIWRACRRWRWARPAPGGALAHQLSGAGSSGSTSPLRSSGRRDPDRDARSRARTSGHRIDVPGSHLSAGLTRSGWR